MTATYDRTYVDATGYEHRYQQHSHDDADTINCAYCNAEVPGCQDCPPPPEGDDSAWTELAEHHQSGCEWVETRAHRREA